MKELSRPRRIEDVRELVQILQLRAVNEDSFSARRGEPNTGQNLGQGVRFEVGVTEDDMLATQFGFQFVAGDCSIESSFIAIWSASEAITVSGAAMGEFLERVAMMAVYPFQREALATYATRLRVPVPTLGLVRQGEIDLKIDPDSLDRFLQDKVFLYSDEKT
ncbi:hypothetical protein ABC337_16245 [Arthrobacter sp. 1P04PC]|uniref:hypothetical protein n=1 Tax=unclassified Arthrobacter TaxID=235627 RepID=UPI0039A1AF1B